MEAFRWAVDWVRPVAGTTAWVRFRRNGRAVDDAVLAERLVQKWAVLVVPGGACFEDRAAAAAEAGAEAVGEGEKGKEKKDDHAVPGEFAGYVRIGYVQSTEVLRQALDVMSRFMMDEGEDGFGRVPLWKGK